MPVTNAGEIVLVSHYRYTVDDWCWEISAGGIHPGQSPQEAAVAELREEIGGTAVTLTPLGRFYTAIWSRLDDVPEPTLKHAASSGHDNRLDDLPARYIISLITPPQGIPKKHI